jgi:hypothetical protein
VTTAARQALIEAARRGSYEGWQRDELPEYVRSAARSLGVSLTPADTSEILRDAERAQ